MKYSLLKIASAMSLSCLLFAAPASSWATTQPLGPLSPNKITWFGNSLDSSVTTFTDYYTFTIGQSSDVWGKTFELDIGDWLNVNLSSITLSRVGVAGSIIDSNPSDGFSFKNLLGGSDTYQLAVSGTVTGSAGGRYIGAIQAIAAPVPEPEDLALTVLGLLGVHALLRQRANKS